MLGEFFSNLAIIAAEAALASTPAAPAVAHEEIAVEAPAPVIAAANAPRPEKPFKLAAAAAPPQDVAAEAPLPAVFEGLPDEAVAASALKSLEALTTLEGNFVQTSPAGAVVSGKFYLRRPGQIRFDYDDPSPITIVATGGMVYVENSDLETTDSYPLKKTPLRFLLSRKIDLGDAVLKSVERAPEQVAVTYASNDEGAEGEVTLVLSAPDLMIEKWAVTDPQGGVTVVALNGVRAGGAFENRLFRAPEAGGAFINN
jgi:outer membrane lipoprotein-sorting protein